MNRGLYFVTHKTLDMNYSGYFSLHEEFSLFHINQAVFAGQWAHKLLLPWKIYSTYVSDDKRSDEKVES